jgi:hypothetical protein
MWRVRELRGRIPPVMRRTVPLLVLLASCSGPERDDVPEEMRVEREHEQIRVEIPDSENLQYLAFCVDEQASVSGWMDSQSEAESAASDHVDRREGHRWHLLWREKPAPPQGR